MDTAWRYRRMPSPRGYGIPPSCVTGRASSVSRYAEAKPSDISYLLAYSLRSRVSSPPSRAIESHGLMA